MKMRVALRKPLGGAVRFHADRVALLKVRQLDLFVFAPDLGFLEEVERDESFVSGDDDEPLFRDLIHSSIVDLGAAVGRQVGRGNPPCGCGAAVAGERRIRPGSARRRYTTAAGIGDRQGSRIPRPRQRLRVHGDGRRKQQHRRSGPRGFGVGESKLGESVGARCSDVVRREIGTRYLPGEHSGSADDQPGCRGRGCHYAFYPSATPGQTYGNM